MSIVDIPNTGLGLEEAGKSLEDEVAPHSWTGRHLEVQHEDFHLTSLLHLNILKLFLYELVPDGLINQKLINN